MSAKAATMCARHVHILGEQRRILYKRKARLTPKGTSSPTVKTVALPLLPCITFLLTLEDHFRVPSLWFVENLPCTGQAKVLGENSNEPNAGEMSKPEI